VASVSSLYYNKNNVVLYIKLVKLPATRRGFPELNYLFRYMPLDRAYKVGLARHETGHPAT
jgi:hypothetical protein